MQVARKIAPCDRALIHVRLAYLFLHQDKFSVLLNVISSGKYLNLIDSNCDVDESCPWFFIGTVLATGPDCIINIYVILGSRNLFEMGAVRSARGFVHMGNNNSVKRNCRCFGRGMFFVCESWVYNIITIQYNLIF